VTTSYDAYGGKRKGDRSSWAIVIVRQIWRTVGQTEGRVTTVPSHFGGGESSRRLCWFVRGCHLHRRCSGV
jgi:hypothetical protein